MNCGPYFVLITLLVGLPMTSNASTAAADVFTPVSGSVTEANGELVEQPELVNTEAEGSGWLFRIALADASELGGLMDRAAYDAYAAEL